MSVLAIILIVIVAVVILMAAGGAVAAQRRQRERAALLLEQVEQANEQLALAKASDRGWDRATMDAAALEAARAKMGSVQVAQLHLVQVVDRPGTDEDEAVFQIETPDGKLHTVTLGRRDGAWVPAA